MRNRTLEELLDLAPAYVMETLNAEEREAVEAALASTPELAQEVAAHRAVVERLSTEQSLAPSADVRARFLDRISSEKSTAFVVDSSANTASGGAASGGAASGAQARANARWWPTALLGAALAASLVFAVNRNSELKSLAARLALSDSATVAQRERAERLQVQINTVLEAEKELLVVNLASAQPDGPGIQFFWNMKQGRGMLHAFRLPPAAPGRAYQLWLIKDGKPVPVKVFNSDTEGHGLVADIDVPNDAKGITLMAVTLEPDTGSAQPTSTPFMSGPVTATQ